jgi:hypothetical protein
MRPFMMTEPNMTTRVLRLPAAGALLLTAFTILCAAPAVSARQAGAQQFRGRLSPLPVTNATVARITGSGEVTATLEGNRLVLTGSFSGTSSAVVAAHLHQSIPGVPGPAIHPLQVGEGTVRGTVELTSAQVAALRANQLYVQIHTENNGDGEIRGWIFPATPAAGAGRAAAAGPAGRGGAGAGPAGAVAGAGRGAAAVATTSPGSRAPFAPVSDGMLRNPDPADWLMIRGATARWTRSTWTMWGS